MRDIRAIIAILSLVLFLLLLLFVIPIRSFDCNSVVCRIYERRGYLGFDIVEQEFYQDDVVSYSIDGYRTKHGRRGSYHNDYSVILELKNGERVEMPKHYCVNKQAAVNIAKGIMRGNSYKRQFQ